MDLYGNKFDYKTVVTMVVSILIVALSVFYICYINFWVSSSGYQAVGGVYDLQYWDGDGCVHLDGEWEFYPGVFLYGDENLSDFADIRKIAEVPGSWIPYLNDGNNADGAGTYRLVIRTPGEGYYGIKTRTIRTSGRVYMNGEELFAMGSPALDSSAAVAASMYKTGMAASSNNELELLIQVSSYGYKTGGILKSIYFGTYDSIAARDLQDHGIDGIVVTVALLMALVSLLAGLQGRKRYFLFFSGTCFFMGLYLATMNEQLLSLLIEYDFMTRMRLQFLAINMVTLCFLWFIHYLIEEYRNRKASIGISILILLNLLLFFSNTVTGKSVLVAVDQIALTVVILISYGYILYVLLRALFSKIEYSGYVLVIALSLAVYWFTFVFKVLFEMDLGYLPVLIIMILMVTSALIMNYRMQLDYLAVKDLSDKLMADNQLKDEFLARAAVKLQAPLNAMGESTRTLIEGKKGTLNYSQQEDLMQINKERRRLVLLAEELQYASQPDKSGVRLNLEAVSPGSIIEEALTEMRTLIPEAADLVLINKTPEQFPLIKADADKFSQILYHLILNAVKFTPAGTITVSGKVENGQAFFTVRDTGIGIKKRDLNEIFALFYQKNDSTVENGLGIGLTIVKLLVEMQGGHVRAESEDGKGSAFTFSLPLYDGEAEGDPSHVNGYLNKVPDHPEARPAVPGAPDDTFSRYNILIVNENIYEQGFISDIVAGMGSSSIIAPGGSEALGIMEQNRIDLLVMDFNLADMPGNEFLHIIRKKYSMAEMPVLVLTASGMNTGLMNLLEDGANDFINKPADADELRSRIQSLLLMKSSVEEGLKKEFQYFYSQISPHFLYNTLNTIIGLCYKDEDMAKQALTNLSVYLRGKLDVYKGESLNTLETELEIARAYLEIEELRYGPRLKIEYDIEDDIKAMLPHLTLQPLVENSVRHGLLKKETGGWIRISAGRMEEGYIRIIVEDNGVGISPEGQRQMLEGESKGLGFKNTMEKLRILKGISFSVSSEPFVGTKITIIVPEVRDCEDYFN